VADANLPAAVSLSDPLSLLGPAGLLRLKAAPPQRRTQALMRAARDFESVLLHKLLEEMKRTIPDSGLLGGAAAKQIEGLFWYHLAQDVANKGGLGLWKDLYRQFAQQSPADGGGASKLEQSR